MKTYTTYIGLMYPSDGGEIHQFTTPDVYQQAHAKHDIDTMYEDNGSLIETFIPWSAVSFANFVIGEESSEPVEDAVCNEEV